MSETTDPEIEINVKVYNFREVPPLADNEEETEE